jgi:hypothetical protein
MGHIAGTDRKRLRPLIAGPYEPHLYPCQWAKGVPRNVVKESKPRSLCKPFRLSSRAYIGGHDLTAALQAPGSPKYERPTRQIGCGLLPLEANRTATGEHEAHHSALFS